jgi:hypothetical protein
MANQLCFSVSLFHRQLRRRRKYKRKEGSVNRREEDPALHCNEGTSFMLGKGTLAWAFRRQNMFEPLLR